MSLLEGCEEEKGLKDLEYVTFVIHFPEAYAKRNISRFWPLINNRKDIIFFDVVTFTFNSTL
jgi:hypothetical protein